MKPTTVSSSVSVIPSNKKDNKPEVKEPDTSSKKREKSPIADQPQRRVFMEPDKNKDERRVSSKQHNVKITVTGDERRRVATGGDKRKGNSGLDLRAKLSEKRRESGHSREYERDRDMDRNVERKRKDSTERRSSRDYDRSSTRSSKSDSSKNRDSGKVFSRKESVIDDSKFEPDYEDESVSEDNISDDSSSDSSSDDEYVKRKHKHKKNKHKKDKKQKKKKEKKKKKHKLEKEKRIKSTH